MNEMIKNLLKDTFKDNVVFDVSAKDFTTFKTGGILSAVVFPSDKTHIELLFELWQKGIPVKFVGCGSNLLISDEGFDGIIAVTKKFSGIDYTKDNISVCCGTKISSLIKFCIDKNIAGFEFLAGIPGTIGGALVNNAGTKEKSISQVVLNVEYIDKKGFWQKEKKNNFVWEYRYSSLKNEAFFIFSTSLITEKGAAGEIKKKVSQIMKKRIQTQPLQYPSAGSVFKNPPGFFAGKLIQDAGLKGLKIGGAMVSEKHANFIVNIKNASSTDVWNLIRHIQQTIRNRYNISLDLEIETVGRFE
ncbi:MAG: UDP-N-acetylmuramate dehydrogenase [Candidatus Omnitrophica bacterium]|nr:UDP-N-acetylmuramate dehydrogenase [Candidatus Omnitrophota bacterium]